jgi:hypothetical protein
VAFTRSQRLGGLALVGVLTVGVITAGVVTAQGSSDRSASASTETVSAPDTAKQAEQAEDAAPAAPAAPEEPRPTPVDKGAPVSADPAVQKQLAYTLAHWQNYNTSVYGVLGTTDCVNFASQTLIERGWEMDDEWWTSGTGADFEFSSPWVSSTAFRNYVASTGRATELTDDQRDQVKLGDIAQFDWDNSGDRDHTGIVTRIEGSGDDIVIYYAGHTEDTDYRSVDYAITERHPGGTAYYWSIP